MTQQEELNLLFEAGHYSLDSNGKIVPENLPKVSPEAIGLIWANSNVETMSIIEEYFDDLEDVDPQGHRALYRAMMAADDA